MIQEEHSANKMDNPKAGKEQREGESARRKKRDPFKGMDPVSADDAEKHGRALKSRAEMKRIKKTGFKHEGKKVVTDDVKILKSLSVTPEIPDDPTNYYVESVMIEYYIPKESRFAREERFLYVPLIDPVPGPDHRILAEHIKENRFFDLMNVMDTNPMYITDILDSYNNLMSMYENLSKEIRDAVMDDDPERYRAAFYHCEVLAEFEPTMASLKILGEFLSWNINWLVRIMNRLGVDFQASDKTVSYFIKRRNIYVEEKGLPYDERFEVLAGLFYEQAFPYRGMAIEDEDFFFDIFDR